MKEVNVAIIRNGKCIDNIQFESVKAAKDFFKEHNIWQDCEIIEQDKNYKIGDEYKGNKWAKKVKKNG